MDGVLDHGTSQGGLGRFGLEGLIAIHFLCRDTFDSYEMTNNHIYLKVFIVSKLQ